MKKTLKHLLALLCCVLLPLSLFSGMALADAAPYDPIDNLDVATEAVGMQFFANNGESGTSCVLRAPAAVNGGTESYLLYKNEGHVATAITVGVQARSEFTVAGFANDLVVSGRAAGATEWTTLEYVAGEYRDLTGSIETYDGSDVVVTVPEGIAEVKVALINGIAWTFGLDYVDIVWEATAPAGPYDPIDNLDVAAEAVGMQFFANNGESGTSCVLRDPAALAGESYLLYKNPGNVATAITVGVQARSEFTVAGFANDLVVSGRAAGSAEWTNLEYVAGEYRDLTGSIETYDGADVTVTVPENIVEVKVALINGIAWTFGLDYVDIVWAASDVPDVIATTVMDPIDNLDVAASNVGMQFFANNSESGTSCVLRDPAALGAESYLTYKLDGNVASAITVGVQARSEFTVAGFAADLAVYGRAASSNEWTALEYVAGEYRDLTGSVETYDGADVTVTVPENIVEVKVALINGIAWTFGLDYVEITWTPSDVVDNPPAPDQPDEPGDEPEPTDPNLLVDPYDNLDLVSSKEGVILQAPHPESKLNVVENQLNGYVTYKKAGYSVGEFGLKIQYYTGDGSTTEKDNIALSYRKANTNEWVNIEYTVSERYEIPSSITPVFVWVDIAPAAALPADAAEIKIALTTAAAWHAFLDETTIKWVESDLVDNPPAPDAPVAPEIEKNYTDVIEGSCGANEMTSNWEFFTPNETTGLTVMSKTDGKLGKLVYYKDGNTISNFALKLQMYPAFTNLANHLLCQVKVGEEWVDVAVENIFSEVIVGDAGNYNISSVLLQPAEVPADATALQVILANDVAWTLAVDEVYINYVAPADPEDPEDPVDPEDPADPEAPADPEDDKPVDTDPMGDSMIAVLAAALLMALAAVVAFVTAKKRA